MQKLICMTNLLPIDLQQVFIFSSDYVHWQHTLQGAPLGCNLEFRWDERCYLFLEEIVCFNSCYPIW